MSRTRKIGLFGGSFDPVHSAHIAVAQEAARNFDLDEVLLVPAAEPPHKETVASYEDRFRMVALACRGIGRLTPSRLEEGSGISYSIVTIRKLQQQLQPGDRIFFLIGADAFAEITTWHRWREVVQSVEFIVMTRPGHEYEVPEGARVHRLNTMELTVSSSAIRDRLAARKRPPELPDAVQRYIQERGLYQDHSDQETD